jgi:hypothetical protein
MRPGRRSVLPILALALIMPASGRATDSKGVRQGGGCSDEVGLLSAERLSESFCTVPP